MIFMKMNRNSINFDGAPNIPKYGTAYWTDPNYNTKCSPLGATWMGAVLCCARPIGRAKTPGSAIAA